MSLGLFLRGINTIWQYFQLLEWKKIVLVSSDAAIYHLIDNKTNEYT